MRVVWLPETRDDIQRIFDFLVSKSPRAAESAMLAIQRGAEQLVTHPSVGRLMDGQEPHRELFVPFGVGAYVLRYRVVGEAIVVVRVWHSRELRG